MQLMSKTKFRSFSSGGMTVPAGRVNSVSDAQERIRQSTFLGTNSVVPVTFGRDRFYVKPIVVHEKDDILYVAYLVGKGEIGGYYGIYVDGVDINAVDGFLSQPNTAVNTYNGSASQTVDPLLSTAITGFASTYANYAYIVLKVPGTVGNGFPRVEVEIEGLKVFNYDSHSPFEDTLAVAGDRNLFKSSVDFSSVDWIAEDNGSVSSTGEFVGKFERVEVSGTDAGAGSTSSAARVRQNVVLAGESALTFYYEFGTSGSVYIQFNDITASTSIIFTAELLNLKIGDESTNAAGTWKVIVHENFGQYMMLKIIFTPAVPGNTFAIGFGPNTTVIGQTMVALGAQIEPLNTGIKTTSNPINIIAYAMTELAKWNVNSSLMTVAANWNNDLIPYDTIPRRTLGMTFSSPTKLSNLIENLRAYTGCFMAWDNGEAHLIPRRPASVSHTIGVDDIEDNGLNLKKKRANEIPTVVIVQFADADNNFAKREVVEKAVGVDAGTVPRRISRVNLPGLHSYNSARREAIERLNEGLSDLLASISVFDKGVYFQVGDVCEVTHPIGLANKQMIVVGLRQESAAGKWLLETMEYDPLLFSLSVESNPTYGDTNLPIHLPPPPVTGIVLTEEVYQRRNGEYDNRITVSWDSSVSPYVQWYLVRYKLGGVVIASVQETGTHTAYGPLEEGVEYTIEVIAVTGLFQGDPSSATITPLGKQLIPGDVPSFSGYEVGGLCLFSWGEAIDLDITGYELRYGVVGVTWENAETVNVISSLRYQTREIPPGTWDFLIKARDSVGQESVNALRTSFEVTLDDESLLIAEGSFGDRSDTDARTHRVKEVREGSEIIYTNSASETWSSLFGSGSLAAFTESMAQYQADPATPFIYKTATFIVGYDVAGDWRASSDHKNYRGIDRVFGIADGGGLFTEYSNLSVKRSGGETYLKFEGIGIARIEVGDPSFRIDAVTRKESGVDVSLTTGGKTITVQNAYSAYKNITVTPIFSGSASAVIPIVDNVVVGATTTFDVYIFDASSPGTRVAVNFNWSFEGV